MKTVRLAALLAALAILTVFAGPAAASPGNTTETPVEGNSTGFDSEAFGGVLENKLVQIFFSPFLVLAQQLLKLLVDLLANTPTVHPNPQVAEIHRLTLSVAYAGGAAAIIFTGHLYLIGPILGYSYSDARIALPRIIAALVFGTISPFLLQYTVELSDALVEVFQPEYFSMSIQRFAGLSTALLIAWVIQAAVLLALVAMFVIRNVYILFIAAISPLIALAWALPNSRPYAQVFISGYWTALAMAPLDILALRFAITLTEAGGTGISQSASNWILGAASFALLIILPYQLYGASRTAANKAGSFSRNTKSRVNELRETESYEKLRIRGRAQLREVRNNRTKNQFDNDGSGGKFP